MKHLCCKVLTLCLVLCLIFGGTVYAESPKGFEANYFDTILTAILDNYQFEADTEQILRAVTQKVLYEHPEMLEELINTTADNLDPYTDYFTPEELEGFTQILAQEYVGIGVSVRRASGAVMIEAVFKNGPAAVAGLQNGDRFLQVDGRDVTDMTIDELTSVVKGPEGTTVELVMDRGGQNMKFSVTRAAVQSSSVAYQDLGDGLGYLSISTFNSYTPADMKEADTFFREKGIKKLIVDLRDNPGGNLVSVVETLGYFVPAGKNVVTVEYKNRGNKPYPLRSVGHLKEPYYDVVVLTNSATASAAELFAGNIRDHGLGILIGLKTFGKGTVQEFMNLLSTDEHQMGSIKLTMAEYVLPGGEKIHGKGIEPGIRVQNRKEWFDDSKFEPFSYDGVYQEGDTGSSVLALKQRFELLGYYVGEVDEQYDRELTLSVRSFQKQVGLPATGVMDIETQILFQNLLKETRIVIDNQLDTAVEYLRGK